MTKPPTKLNDPPWLENAQQQSRRVGIELEMNGINLDDLAQLVAGFINGEVTHKGRYERTIGGDDAGNWIAELDFDLLKRLGREHWQEDTLVGEIGNSAEEILAWLSEPLVPVELVTPPLPLNRLDSMETLIERLRDAGALGTTDKLTNAFGMHFNPEIPSEDPDVIRRIFQAFLCLYDWLHDQASVDLTRRVTTYIDPFPKDYVRKVIDPQYQPDMPTLIDDYLRANPTRNRALDMLPLFMHLDKERVRKVTQDSRIKARPAFHYRLPNCDIHRTRWGFHLAWHDWLEVEYLAADSKKLTACCKDYCQHLDNTIERWLGDWKRQVEQQWLHR